MTDKKQIFHLTSLFARQSISLKNFLYNVRPSSNVDGIFVTHFLHILDWHFISGPECGDSRMPFLVVDAFGTDVEEYTALIMKFLLVAQSLVLFTP